MRDLISSGETHAGEIPSLVLSLSALPTTVLSQASEISALIDASKEQSQTQDHTSRGLIYSSKSSQRHTLQTEIRLSVSPPTCSSSPALIFGKINTRPTFVRKQTFIELPGYKRQENK